MLRLYYKFTSLKVCAHLFMEGFQPPEQIKKPFLRITLMRHEEPFYKGKGTDLTEEGTRGALETGRDMAETIDPEDELYLLSSPSARTRGTLKLVAEGAGLKDEPQRSVKVLRMGEIRDMERFKERIASLGDGQGKEGIARDQYTNPEVYEHDPSFIEPNSKKRERLYRAFEYLLRWLGKHQEAESAHVIAVSHFEIITHLIHDVFGIENVGRYNAPSFGEKVDIEGFHTDSPDKVLLKVSYNEHSKVVHFNRLDRSIEIEDSTTPESK
jgi:broad specificity phosphatase PhoE